MIRKTMFLMLAIGSVCHATMLVVLAAEPNEPPCEQIFYAAPAGIDPNLIEGVLLPPFVDPLAGGWLWTVPTGKLVRVGQACDPDGHSFTVTSRTPGWTVTCDPNASAGGGTWTLAGEVVAGPQYVYVSVTDDPPYAEAKTSYYTIYIYGEPPENHYPILCSLGWLAALLLTARWRCKRV